MDKLQRPQQRNMSIEQYKQLKEKLMMRESIKEEPHMTITRFQSGL